MSIEELTAIVKPPKRPVQVGSDSQWRKICAKLGVVFPHDYRDYCRTYGSGAFLGGEIYIFNAFDPEFVDVFESQQDRVQAFHEVYDMPYPAFPTLPGAIKLGGDGLGNDLLYLARPRPQPWGILTVENEQEGNPDIHEMPLTTFLARIFSRILRCNIWNDENYFGEGCEVTFEPDVECMIPAALRNRMSN